MTVRSNDFSIKLQLPKMGSRRHYEAIKWCEQQFGARWSVTDNKNGVWCCFWSGRKSPGMYEWLFVNEQDSLIFALKWMGNEK